MKKDTKIISAFPGTGKTWFFEHSTEVVLDSDSSKFDKSGFPHNYIRHIMLNIGTVDKILVSSHLEVRQALVANGLFFKLVFPVTYIKDEYLERFRVRGSPQAFIDLIDQKWDEWLTDCLFQDECLIVQLGRGQFLSDYI